MLWASLLWLVEAVWSLDWPSFMHTHDQGQWSMCTVFTNKVLEEEVPPSS